VGCLVASESQGYMVLFKGPWCFIFKHFKLIAQLPKKDHLWYLETGPTLKANAVQAAGPNDLSLWHLRLNHLNKRALYEMYRKGMLPGVKLEKEDEAVINCIGCNLGKLAKEPHRRMQRDTKRLDLVHTDLCGPMDTLSLLFGKAYVLTFIDDCTRRSWVYLLKHKDEVFGFFQEWLPLVERQGGCLLKTLRSDGGAKRSC